MPIQPSSGKVCKKFVVCTWRKTVKSVQKHTAAGFIVFVLMLVMQKLACALAFWGVVHWTVWRKRGRREAAERKGRRKGTIGCGDF